MDKYCLCTKVGSDRWEVTGRSATSPSPLRKTGGVAQGRGTCPGLVLLFAAVKSNLQFCGDSDDSSESSDICVDSSVLSDHSDVGSDASGCEFGVYDLETAPAQPTARAAFTPSSSHSLISCREPIRKAYGRSGQVRPVSQLL
ncbi:hypothetical protein J6590_084012 [Homalodisca vitripennis]|nr:hypothetical protein J6590_084012 [Homalodisca vitripennis]